jgi:hypothetical protein
MAAAASPNPALKAVAQALYDSFSSQNVLDANGEDANVTDVLNYVAGAVHHLARAQDRTAQAQERIAQAVERWVEQQQFTPPA